MIRGQKAVEASVSHLSGNFDIAPSLFQIENGLLSPMPIVFHSLAPQNLYCQVTFCEPTICL